jgi:ABC-2 type transport system permease protein
MRFVALLRKSLIETLRDWKILSLTLAFAPLFVLLMKFYVGESAGGPYRVCLVNTDLGASTADGGTFTAGADLANELALMEDLEGERIFDLEFEKELNPARQRLTNGAVDLVVHIPVSFSQVLLDAAVGDDPKPVTVETYGDPSNANYLMAAIWSDMVTYEYAAAVVEIPIPVEIQAHTLSGAQTLNEFELYIPALLALSLMMLMFTAAAALIREKDKGTIIRLRLANMTTFEWLSAVTLTQLMVGVLALIVTYLTAVAFGYQPLGSPYALLLIGALGSLAIVGISILVAAYLRTIFDLLTIGCFPFFILMFFSGGMFPLPPVRLFSIGDRAIQLNEVLPTTHAITAMEKVLNAGTALPEIGYELVAMAILTVVYFVLGVTLFTRRHMRVRAQL